LRGTFVAAALLLGTGAHAADLRIGVASEATTLDPHFFHLTPNTEIHKAIYSAIVTLDAKQNIIPDLATSWRTLDQTHWEFKLRPGVTFHDGTPFTADDVIFTYQRARNVPGSPASFQQFLKRVVGVTAPDPLTVIVETSGPDPILPNELQNVWIVSRKSASASSRDYNSGAAAIGTGPYKLVRWVPADRLELVRNDAYFGPKPEWEHVAYKPITNDAARLAALLSGDVDLINNVPSNDIADFAQRPNFALVQLPSDRIIYITLDSDRDVTPMVTALDGSPLPKNPLKDLRVRRALSKAIDRANLVNLVLQGQGKPAGQFAPDYLAGASPNLRPEPFDLDAARKLLAEAGYPNGFAMTLAGPNDRYPNDATVVQTVAQMWSKLGLRIKVDTMPKSIYFTRVNKLDFSASLTGNSSDTAEPMSQLQYCLGTYDFEHGIGAGNPGRYSNPAFDKLVAQATQTLDNKARADILARAAELALGQDVAAVPIYHLVAAWGMKKGLSYEGFPQEATVAALVHGAK
jgi:peptide/nickel transport system substrate-binding protein